MEFFKQFLVNLLQGERCFPRDLRPETTKLQGGKSDIMSHGSTQRNAMDMGVVANERAGQIAYIVKRLNFFKVILGTWCRGKWGNQPILEVLGSRMNGETCYGYGTHGK